MQHPGYAENASLENKHRSPQLRRTPVSVSEHQEVDLDRISARQAELRKLNECKELVVHKGEGGPLIMFIDGTISLKYKLGY